MILRPPHSRVIMAAAITGRDSTARYSAMGGNMSAEGCLTCSLCRLPINRAIAKGYDIIDCPGAALIGFNDDGRHSRKHPVAYTVDEVCIQGRHHRIAA